MIRITDDISINECEISEVFIRSSGPGGQNVNKVSTAVQLRFDIVNSRLPQEVKERLTSLGGARVTNEGVLIISSSLGRKRELNRVDASDKLIALIKKACQRPKRRVKTRPSRAAKERRIVAKKERSGTKKMRKKVNKDE